MNFIVITLKITITTNQNYYSQKMIVECMKLKFEMSMKTLAAIKKRVNSVIIQLSQTTMMIKTN